MLKPPTGSHQGNCRSTDEQALNNAAQRALHSHACVSLAFPAARLRFSRVLCRCVACTCGVLKALVHPRASCCSAAPPPVVSGRATPALRLQGDASRFREGTEGLWAAPT
eukprot:scaffold22875_cov103-Isochrysis_galbana.AAC.1